MSLAAISPTTARCRLAESVGHALPACRWLSPVDPRQRCGGHGERTNQQRVYDYLPELSRDGSRAHTIARLGERAGSRAVRQVAAHAISLIVASACSSQKRMSISRYSPSRCMAGDQLRGGRSVRGRERTIGALLERPGDIRKKGFPSGLYRIALTA